MTDRLPWCRKPDHEGAYVAYPLGEDLRRCYAMVWPESGMRHGEWRWQVRIGHPDRASWHEEAHALRNGLAPTDAEAAAAATAAWPEVLAEGKAKGLVA